MKKIFLAALFYLTALVNCQADFCVATGQITSPTSTGSQSITGLTCTPKIIFFYSTIVTSLTDSYNMGMGAGTSSSARWAIGFNAVSSANFSNSYVSRQLTASKIISIPYTNGTPTNAIYLDADLTSLNSDGATINWTTVQASGYPINYVALGGSSLSVKVGTFDSSSSTGNKAVTGVGFTPTSELIVNGIGGTTEGVTNTVRGSIGFASSASLAEALCFQHATSGSSPLWDASAGQVAAQAIERCNNGATFQATADFLSQDSDGFTVHFSTNAATIRYGYVAIGGISSAVGAISQPSSTGNQSVTGLSFQPAFTFLIGNGHTTTSSGFQNYNVSIGAGVDSSHRNVSNFAGTQSAGGSRIIAGSDGSTSKVVQFITPNTGGGAPSLNSDADFVSNNSDGFTINWTTADATAREVAYWTMGTVAAATPTSNSFLASDAF